MSEAAAEGELLVASLGPRIGNPKVDSWPDGRPWGDVKTRRDWLTPVRQFSRLFGFELTLRVPPKQVDYVRRKIDGSSGGARAAVGYRARLAR